MVREREGILTGNRTRKWILGEGGHRTIAYIMLNEFFKPNLQKKDKLLVPRRDGGDWDWSLKQ